MNERPTIFHVDMDAFYASVEVRDDPSLRGKPVLVGGIGNRGVVAAASYEARRYGCHSAQPMAMALRLCPHAVVLPSRFDVYAEVSDQVFAIFDRFSPTVEALSIDEAFLDMTGTQRLLGSPAQAAQKLRATVREETGLTCSVGISSVKFLAKIASGINKPDGLTEVAPGDELDFLHPLPIGALWGVGPKTEARLRDYAVRTVGDLARMSGPQLQSWFGEHGVHLHQLSQGIDPRPVEPGRGRKSLGHEDTYAVDVRGRDALRRKLLSQATRVADRLIAAELRGRRIQLKIRDSSFKTETRQCMLSEPTSEAKRIYNAVSELLDAVELDGRSFRLTGVSVGALEPAASAKEGQADQLDLLDLLGVEPSPPSRGAQLQEVLSAVRGRYGHQALFPADAGGTERAGSAGNVTHTRDSRGPSPGDE